jgi:hypothetical protein
VALPPSSPLPLPPGFNPCGGRLLCPPEGQNLTQACVGCARIVSAAAIAPLPLSSPLPLPLPLALLEILPFGEMIKKKR